jgi:Ca2+-transporting ATPase
VGIATVGVFVNHYLEHGVTLSQLSSWGKCGQFWNPINSSVSCSDLFTGKGRTLPQTLSLTTLVCMEMLKALSAVSVDSSLFTMAPHKNPLLILGVTVPMILHLLVVYSSKLGLPGLGESFGVVPLSLENWYSVLKWTLPILLVEEILKGVGRRLNAKENKN